MLMTCFDFNNTGPDCTLGALTGMIWLTMPHTQEVENAAFRNTESSAYQTYSAPGHSRAGTGETLYLLLWGSASFESHKRWTG